MKQFLIGCSVLVVLGVIALGAVGFLFVGNFKEMVQDVGQSGDRFTELEEEYPFKAPQDWVIDPERFEIYIACRQGIHDAIHSAKDDFKEEPGWKKPVKTLSMIPSVIKDAVEILSEHGISWTEYRWYDEEVWLVARKGEAHEQAEVSGDTEASDRAGEWVDLLESFENSELSGDGNNGFGWQVDGSKGSFLESRIDPRRVIVPTQNIEIVWEHREVLKATADVAEVARMFSF